MRFLVVAAYNSFHSQIDVDCPICFFPIQNEESIAHNGEGIKHPIHLKCAQLYASANKNHFCPTCRIPVDLKKYKIKDRSININWIVQNFLGSINYGILNAIYIGRAPYENYGFIGPSGYFSYHMFHTDETYGSIIGGVIGTFVGSALITGAVMVDNSSENQEGFTGNYESFNYNSFTMFSFSSIGMSLGAYIERKYM